MTVVVDTNVILVANRQHDDVSELCVAECARRLNAIVKEGRVAIDDAHRILKEYQNKTTPRAGKRVGDLFLKWLLQNQANPSRCDLVKLDEHDQRGFQSFPDDASLSSFDTPDRKFVAVAGAHPGKPPILQAADSKWIDWAVGLSTHQIVVDFVCPEDIKAFDKKKKAKKARR